MGALRFITDFFSKIMGEIVAKLVGEIIVTAFIGFVIFIRKYIVRHAAIAYRSISSLVRGRRYILLWIDTHQIVAQRLVAKIQTRFKDSDIRILNAPAALLRYPMRPRFTEAIVLLNTDVSKLAADDRLRDKLQLRIEAFLLRGGGLIGTHDVIYRRARNERLQRAFGGKVTDFRGVDEPVEYIKVAEHRDHPISRHMPTRFSLRDGEIIWGQWAADTQTLFETPEPDRHSLVVVRNYHRGRLVWLSSCDQGEQVCRAIGVPEVHFVDLLAASMRWVTQRHWTPRSYPFVVAHRGIGAGA